jgi:hypothetical protein
MHLQELQNTLQQYLMTTVGEVTITAEITPVAKGNIAERLNIYHQAYRSRIREALSSQFPNLAKLLGTELFNQYMDEFISNYPSTHRNMRWLGDQLSEFFQEYAPNKPIYGDIANFEWRLGLAFDSLDMPCLTIQDLSVFTPEQWGDLSFEWHPSVYLGQAQTNVIRVWMLLEDNDKANLEMELEPTQFLVWRKELVSQFKSLSALEADAIAYMMQHHTFGELCENLSANMDGEDVLPYAAGLLSQWLQEEMLVCVALKTEI